MADGVETLLGLIEEELGEELAEQAREALSRRRDETDDYLNELNQALLAQMQSGGELFLSNAVIDGRYLLRACIVNFRTAEADIDALPELIAELGRAAHRRLQGSR